MSTLVYNADNKLIHQSRNLRGLLDHARREVPVSVECALPDSQGFSVIYVYFANGDQAATNWADWRVAADWLARRRSWPRLQVRGDTLRNNADFKRRYLQA